MAAITKTLLFSSLANADPASPPVGYSLATGSDPAAIFSGRFSRSSGVQAVWLDNTTLAGATFSASVTLDSTVSSDAHGCALLNSSTGSGYMVITGTSADNFRIFEVVAGQIGGAGLLATFSVSPLASANIELALTGTTLTVKQNGTVVGTHAGASSHSVNRAGVVARGSAGVVSMTSSYEAAQSITSINGSNPITAGQTDITVIAEGFTAKPTGVTATYEYQDENDDTVIGSISATIGAGTATNFAISIQDRIDGEDWPLNNTAVTFTFTYGSETASLNKNLVKKASEVVYTFSGAVTTDPQSIAYHLTEDGFTAEGGEHVYLPYGDLALTAEGGWTVTDAGTFPSWFRPATGTGAGNVYEYQWQVTEAGISPISSKAITAKALTCAGLSASGFVCTPM